MILVRGFGGKFKYNGFKTVWIEFIGWKPWDDKVGENLKDCLN